MVDFYSSIAAADGLDYITCKRSRNIIRYTIRNALGVGTRPLHPSAHTCRSDAGGGRGGAKSPGPGL